MTQRSYTITELSETTGVSPRNIRFYTAQGLLPPPEVRGRQAVYTDLHASRLRVIRRLRDAQLSIPTIRTALTDMSEEEMARMAAEGETGDDRADVPTTEPTSAAQYVARVLESLRAPELRTPPESAGRSLAWATPPSRESPQPLPALRPTDHEPSGEAWERIVLRPGLELHVRTPAAPEVTRIVRQIILIAKPSPRK